MTFGERFMRMLVSWTRLPLWVLIWVFVFLGPVNLAGFFFLDSNLGIATAVAVVLAFGSNTWLIIANGGVSKVMAIPHLIAWIPLEIYALYQLLLTDNIMAGSNLAWFAWALVVINGISLAFDVYDTKEWRAGNRELTGFPDAEPKY